MKLAFVLVLLLSCSYVSQGQHKILLLNNENNKLYVIAENQWVKFTLDSIQIHKSKYVKGFLLSLTDSVAQLVIVRSFFHQPSIDTVCFPSRYISHAGLYHPYQEMLFSLGSSLLWSGACIVVTSAVGGGLGTFVLLGLATMPVSFVSEYYLKKAIFPVYPLHGKTVSRVTDEQLHAR